MCMKFSVAICAHAGDGLQSRSSKITSCPERIEHHLQSEGHVCVLYITKLFSSAA